MVCLWCGSDRILSVSSKCSDRCFVSLGDKEHDGYVPNDLNIGGGDYLEIDLCVECGRIQGDWPLSDQVVSSVFER